MNDLLATANGRLDVVAGPAKVAYRYLELWASNLMTAMLSPAWRPENATQYRCSAAFFDIRNGEIKTDAFLINASDHTVAAAGKLDLGTEDLDVVASPNSKDLALLSLAVPIRLTGPLAAPNVSTDPASIAASKAWQMLDVAEPIGATLRVPDMVQWEKKSANSSTGDNPCVIALKQDGKETLSTVKVVKTGFERLADFLRGAGSTVVDFFGGYTSPHTAAKGPEIQAGEVEELPYPGQDNVQLIESPKACMVFLDGPGVMRTADDASSATVRSHNTHFLRMGSAYLGMCRDDRDRL